jgi:Na+-translocating ferredoxin:NAD+ oxidoreductase RNF subunit RnfB
MAISNKDKLKQIYDILPQLNCGLCGYGNCGQFAKAVAEGRASPFGCRQDPWGGYRISEIMGTKVPIFGYHYRFGQPAFGQRPESLASIGSLSAEVEELSKRIKGILDRLASLEVKRAKR